MPTEKPSDKRGGERVEQPPELSAEDERLLDEVNDRIGRESTEASRGVVDSARKEYPLFRDDEAKHGVEAALYNAGFAAGWEAAKSERDAETP